MIFVTPDFKVVVVENLDQNHDKEITLRQLPVLLQFCLLFLFQINLLTSKPFNIQVPNINCSGKNIRFSFKDTIYMCMEPNHLRGHSRIWFHIIWYMALIVVYMSLYRPISCIDGLIITVKGKDRIASLLIVILSCDIDLSSYNIFSWKRWSK